MIDIDWTMLGTINAWQSIVTIAVVIIALFIIARFLIRFWPWLAKVIALFDALGKLPPFITDMETFRDRTNDAVDDIRHEVKFNNGSSVKDAIGRVEIGLDGLHKKVDAQRAALESADANIRKELEETKPTVPKPARKPRTKKEQ